MSTGCADSATPTAEWFVGGGQGTRIAQFGTPSPLACTSVTLPSIKASPTNVL